MMRAGLRLVAYLLFTLACMPVQVVLLRVSPEWAGRFPVWYHRCCLRLFGIRVQTVGSPAGHRPCLFVSNHSSYLDVPVLSSLLPVCFVAKSEVAGWPLFGQLARLQRTLFIDRRVKQIVPGQGALAARLQDGEALVLFPEGTSSDGVRVLPFRPALLQTALDQARGTGLTVQPVSIFCAALDGVVADRLARQRYAWFGDMSLLPHLWRFCQQRSALVRVVFHPALDLAALTDRQTLARTAEHLVAEGLVA